MLADAGATVRAIKDGHRRTEVLLPRVVVSDNMILDHGRESSTFFITSQGALWLRARYSFYAMKSNRSIFHPLLVGDDKKRFDGQVVFGFTSR